MLEVSVFEEPSSLASPFLIFFANKQCPILAQHVIKGLAKYFFEAIPCDFHVDLTELRRIHRPQLRQQRSDGFHWTQLTQPFHLIEDSIRTAISYWCLLASPILRVLLLLVLLLQLLRCLFVFRGGFLGHQHSCLLALDELVGDDVGHRRDHVHELRRIRFHVHHGLRQLVQQLVANFFGIFQSPILFIPPAHPCRHLHLVVSNGLFKLLLRIHRGLGRGLERKRRRGLRLLVLAHHLLFLQLPSCRACELLTIHMHVDSCEFAFLVLGEGQRAGFVLVNALWVRLYLSVVHEGLLLGIFHNDEPKSSLGMPPLQLRFAPGFPTWPRDCLCFCCHVFSLSFPRGFAWSFR
mmetsp:Transcript_22700/g.44231  ORF Transcript_22700/g.44231 Transcript_22700/m.44231 type:complete len:350 (-) Transcript_22700:94-1143(-)